ncbi:MAG: YbaK/prolyl-tRNA synthetase associated region [Parcubacteria group bacterium Athens0714_26]|nr:MAG: YbaK/prolyl-tRNA synthetase associated region [Parcubacteria group bacterium Athens1014_26]TSD01291.1 MAG: YbaK/prolyl-tRNA synthetase associated region [Parcubacteria group bacterium Athens0714_26]
MIDPNNIYKKLINLLDSNQVEYKLFSHKDALTWEDLAVVQKEAGFFGTEMKCMVLKVDDELIVYITLQGKKINFDVIKEKFGATKVRFSTPEELSEHFGAKPGCAYPFGFDARYDIYIDPEIYKQDWLLFSPVIPTQTVQARGSDLKKVFDSLDNNVQEVTDFNQ